MDLKYPDFGKKVSCTVSRNGDLIHKVYLEVTLEAMTEAGNSALQLEFENPKGKRSVKTGSAVSNPATDGKIQYTDSTGIFDISGRWKVRGVTTYSSGNKFYGTWIGFQVSD